MGFPGGASGKESIYNAGDPGSIPESRRSPGGTHVHPWVIRVDVWQKPPQYCKVISLQLKQIKKRRSLEEEMATHSSVLVWNRGAWRATVT